MPAPPRLRVEAVAGPAFELLVGLYAATSPNAPEADEGWVPARSRWSPELRAAVDATGERSGEAWLHLLGLALELPHDDARSFVRRVARVPQAELRRHLVGAYVPAWVHLVGADALERAAAGEPDAIAEILAHPRYYAGEAREALAPLITLSARETKERVVAALELFADEVLAPRERELTEALAAGAHAVSELATTLPPAEVVARVTQGYVYEPEPEFERVLLVPHVAARPALLLCQHRESRVICYPLPHEHVDPEQALAERAVALGRALGDARRVQILRYLAAQDASLDELAANVALARSTAHHHLAQLRAAGLVTLRGNARGYWYVLRPAGLAEAQRAVSELARAPSALPARARARRGPKS